VWSLLGGKPIQAAADYSVSKTAESERITKALKARGFKFVGPVLVHAWMQAVGMINDHERRCFRRAELTRLNGH
jgi:DNA-3-methyladenine glycosylase I